MTAAWNVVKCLVSRRFISLRGCSARVGARGNRKGNTAGHGVFPLRDAYVRTADRVAAQILAQKLSGASHDTRPVRSRVTFRILAADWEATVLPMYKHSTQKNHRHIAAKHLVPRFGDKAVSDITRQEVQAYVAHLTQAGYAPKTIDHIHDVLSAVLRAAVKWGHVQENPARGVDLPPLKTVRPKSVLTIAQAAALLAELPPLARTMAGIAMLPGLRRGELFALRWRSVNLIDRHLNVQEAVYEGMFGTPKTEAGIARTAVGRNDHAADRLAISCNENRA